MVMENRPVDPGSIQGNHRPISFIRIKHRTRADDILCKTVDKSPKVYTQLAGFCGWVPEALCNPAQMRTQGGPAFRGSQARIPRDVCVASYEAAREAYEFRGSQTCSCFRLYTILRSRVLLLSCLVCMLGRSCIGVSADTRRGSPVMQLISAGYFSTLPRRLQ